MRGPHAARVAVLCLALAVALGVGLVSARRVRDQLAVIEACDAAGRGDWNAALSRSEGRVGADETGRAAAECRCTALLAGGAGSECAALLESVLGDPEADGWAPNPALSVHLVQTWRDAGRTLEAAELARRAARQHPESPELFYLEMVTRSAHEDEGLVLDELETRLPAAGHAAARMRVSLAHRHLQRGEPERALRALGDAPPSRAGNALGAWFETKGMAYAHSGDLAGLERTYTAWSRAGGSAAQLRARRALTLSIAGLQPPGPPVVELLSEALGAGEPLGDPKLEEALSIRLVLTLVSDGRLDEAIAVYDRARERFALEGLSRDELERSAQQRRWQAAPAAERRGALRFAIPQPAAGATLLLSPEPGADPDAAYESFGVPASGEILAERGLGVAPQRWVYRDPQGRTLASGTVSPRPGGSVDVAVWPRMPRPSERADLSRRPGDGRRRVAMLLLDCADWRIVQYLRARGDLPVLDALLESGHRAVLESDPPLTAAALESLVWPRRRGDASFVGLVHRMGLELAGLASVGENPFGALSWLLPEERDLFSAIGAGPHAAANLLFAHGGIRAGRHNEVTGPDGRRRRVPLATSGRDLDTAERARWPELAAVRRERDAIHLRTIAAEFDTAEEIVRAGEVDFLALRIEPLDILTHAHFADAVRDDQDDGERLLFSVYRYIDARLGDVHDLLDEDDVFIVMSDHGIRTAMEHSRHALFVATGAGVPRGRASGTPALRGVSRVVTDLLGVASDWPDTGVAPWARTAPPRLAGTAAKPHPAPAVP